MSLVKTYKEYILEQLLLEYLYDGEIPTPDMLQTDLEEYQEFHKDLSLPKSKYINVEVAKGSSSSAAKIEEIADAFSSDVSVITREIMRLAKDSSSYYERWTNELRRISIKSNKLEQQINSLLLMEDQTTGYFAYVGDTFSDLSFVDMDLTTAYLNTEECSCSIDPLRGNAGASSVINLNGLTEADVAFSPVTRRPGVAYFNLGNKNSLVQLFKPGKTTWTGKIVSSTSGDMTAEMKIRLSQEKEFEVSRISFIYAGPDASQKSSITAQYSLDGYTWYLLPTSEATKPLTANITWHFPLTKMMWLKLIFYKPLPDSGKYEYIYSASNIKLFGVTYTTDTGYLLVSKALQAIDEKDDVKEFTSVRLDTCDLIPDGTDIKYYVSASTDGTNWEEWARIAPSDEEGLLYPKVINFGGLRLENNQDSDTSILVDSTITLSNPQMRITSSFDEDYIAYRFKDKNFGLINTAIDYIFNPSIVADNIHVWRNIRVKDSYPDVLTVRGVPRGWGLEGQEYSCFFEIINPAGKSFDFGKTTCLINNTVITGTVTIPKGIHKFTTSKDNWFDIAGNIEGLTVDTEELLKKHDPLYPYNHKLIIEGYPYPNIFSGEKKYLGADLSAEFYSTKVSLFDLENNAKDYSSFAVRGIGDAEESIYALGVFLKCNFSNPDYVNELSIVKWKSDNTGQGLFMYVKLKAELETTSSHLTPQLTAYRIQLGN
jgi:hypothetical protein